MFMLVCACVIMTEIHANRSPLSKVFIFYVVTRVQTQLHVPAVQRNLIPLMRPAWFASPESRKG
jgi:hypothetical protein